jgi:hypothetical protein
MEPTTGEYDSNIAGFKAFYLITFLLAMVWVGIQLVLVPTFILSQTGSAADVALVLTLMSLGALPVHWIYCKADKISKPVNYSWRFESWEEDARNAKKNVKLLVAKEPQPATKCARN